MEEIREEKIAQILSWLQAFIRGHMSRLTYKKLQAQKVRFETVVRLVIFLHVWKLLSYTNSAWQIMYNRE